MPRALPYPGHTWSFTQHSIGIKPNTIFSLLACAAPFEGQTRKEYPEKITELIIQSEILTPNWREGKNDAWRDYQQVLAELGLIVSTKICPTLTLTVLGHMFLAGEIGFSELIGSQAFRYQYPNGQKTTIQSRQKKELQEASLPCPETLIELQVNNGVLLKPGLLVFRVLLELQRVGADSCLSLEECQAFLLPCRTNAEWQVAVAEIISNRSNPVDLSKVNQHSRRNFSDWFKLLGKSDFFTLESAGKLQLSHFAHIDIDGFVQHCEEQGQAETYWIPVSFEQTERLDWFRWFGSLPLQNQVAIRLDVEKDRPYLEENYPLGISEEGNEAIHVETQAINLSPLDFDALGQTVALELPSDPSELAEKLLRGMQKRLAKAQLHDQIVKELAVRFQAQGATVLDDPDSIDLYAEWPSGESAIFEVKTVTRRTISGQIRTAVGQVEEYEYRRLQEGNNKSDRIVVINSEVGQGAWRVGFLTEYLGIGLICNATNAYCAYAPQQSLTSQFWLPKP